MKKRWIPYLALMPVIVIIILFYLIPIYNTFDASLHDFYDRYIGFEVFSNVLSDKSFQNAFFYTIKMASVTTIVSIILAILTAMALRDTPSGKRLVLFCYQLNVSIPHITMATMVLFIFGQSGIVSSIAYQLGYIDNWFDFPKIVDGSSMLGTVISFCLKFIPFIGLSVLSVLLITSKDYEDQSQSLGVGKFRTFFHVTLPSLKNSIFSMSMIVFAYCFGSYEVPTMLGKSQTLAMMAYNCYTNYYDVNAIYTAYIISLLIAIVTISVALVYLYITTRSETEVVV